MKKSSPMIHLSVFRSSPISGLNRYRFLSPPFAPLQGRIDPQQDDITEAHKGRSPDPDGLKLASSVGSGGWRP